MPKNDKRMNGFENTHPEDLAAKEEKFRTFFSTSVAQVPDEMKRRDNDQKNPDTGKLGILSRILGRAKEEAAAEPAEEPKAQPQELPPTGEIRLGGEEEAAEPEADLELAADFFAPETPAQTPAAPEASPAPTPKAAAPAAQKPEKPAAPKLEKNYVRGPLTPQEQKEQSEMQELIASLQQRQRKDAYEQIKIAVQALALRNDIGLGMFPKTPEPLRRDQTYRYQHDREDLLDALAAMQDRSQRKLPPPVSNFAGIVGAEPYPVAKKAAEVLRRLIGHGVMKFLSLFKGSRSRSEIVATFLSVLELCRLHSVRIEDTDAEQEIAFVQKPDEKDLSWEE